MTGVYEHALGEDAAALHPKVRERYGIASDDGVACIGRGEMDITHGALFLPVLAAMPAENLLFPETGEDVPFTVTTVGHRLPAGHEALTTRRAFEFGDRTRTFDSLTVWDADRGRLFDFLGTHGLVASELHPRVEDGALVVEGGKQWARPGGRYVPLPGALAAEVTVRDRYDADAGCFHVDASVHNGLAGELVTYRGEFTQEFREMDPVPADLRPVGGLSTLPP
jgi:hypothetical protein